MPGAVYYLYVMVWNSRNPVGTLHIETIDGYADLSQGSSIGFDVSVK